MKKNYKAKKDAYQVVTDRIIEQMEKGIIPWKRPWNGWGPGPQNLVSKKAYQGLNYMLLSCSGFQSPFFLTFKQTKDLGGNVKKGSKGLPVAFWKWFIDEDKDKKFPMVRYSTVFNVEQCEGIEVPEVEVNKAHTFNPVEKAEQIIKGYRGKPEIRHGEASAYYQPGSDFVNMPHKETFISTPDYYHVLFHELSHSTGHQTRLNREGVATSHSFGDKVYSKEELVAEFSAAFLSNECQFMSEGLVNNQASYIQGWLKRLRSDKKLLFSASSQATKATNHILGITPDYEGGK